MIVDHRIGRVMRRRVVRRREGMVGKPDVNPQVPLYPLARHDELEWVEVCETVGVALNNQGIKVRLVQEASLQMRFMAGILPPHAELQ